MNTINIKALSEQVSKLSSSGGGSGLPEVTAADNGKVLGVVEGSWSKMDAPSGVVDYSTTEQDTGRKWVDGSPIYSKTYTGLTYSSSSADNWVNTNLELPEVNILVSVKIWQQNGLALNEIDVAYVDPELSNRLRFKYHDTGTINVIYIEYTKNVVTIKRKKNTK